LNAGLAMILIDRQLDGPFLLPFRGVQPFLATPSLAFAIRSYIRRYRPAFTA